MNRQLYILWKIYKKFFKIVLSGLQCDWTDFNRLVTRNKECITLARQRVYKLVCRQGNREIGSVGILNRAQSRIWRPARSQLTFS